MNPEYRLRALKKTYVHLQRQCVLPWQLESVLDVRNNLHLKFYQNLVSNNWDIANIEFVWGGGLAMLG